MYQLSDIVRDLIIILVAIALIWFAGLRIYLVMCLKFYQRGGVFLKAREGDNPKKVSLLRFFFYRQQTYEYAAYAILILCILFLISCICIFIFANQIVIETSAGHEFKGNEFIISSLSLRIGISVVVFFICQVLLRLYRYCLRCCAFYVGLFDALFIAEDKPLNLKKATKLFMPNIDVGKEPPKSPTQEIIEALKAAKDLKPTGTVGA